jgi:hypothetical protein
MTHGLQTIAMLSAGLGLVIVAAFPDYRYTRFFFTFTWYRWLPSDPIKHWIGPVLDRVGLAAAGSVLVTLALLSLR